MRTLPLLACLTILLSACGAGERTAGFDIPGGATLYARHCSACHGQFGDGDGPVAVAMSVGVPSLRDLTRRENGEFPRESLIEYIDGRELPAAHGDRMMPVWGDTFSGEPGTEDSRTAIEKISEITDFLEQLQN